MLCVEGERKREEGGGGGGVRETQIGNIDSLICSSHLKLIYREFIKSKTVIKN